MDDPKVSELIAIVHELCRHLADEGPAMVDARALYERSARLKAASASSTDPSLTHPDLPRA